MTTLEIKSVEISLDAGGQPYVLADLFVIIDHAVPYLSFPKHKASAYLILADTSSLLVDIDRLTTGRDLEHEQGVAYVDFPKIVKLAGTPAARLPNGGSLSLKVTLVGEPGGVIIEQFANLVHSGRTWAFGR